MLEFLCSGNQIILKIHYNAASLAIARSVRPEEHKSVYCNFNFDVVSAKVSFHKADEADFSLMGCLTNHSHLVFPLSPA